MAEKKDNNGNAEEMTTLATTTRSVVESYIFATGHQNLSIYSERLLMLLVRAAQCQVAGLNFRDGSGISQVSIGPLGDACVEIEARELLNGPNNTNYTQAKRAVTELMEKTISHERPAMKNGKPVLNERGEQVYEFEAHNLVNDVWINRKPGVVVVNVNRTTWEAILDFSKGFRRYDLQVAMQFSKTCSLRMFKLVSNQTKPLQYTIAELREQWGLTDKYPVTKDFIRNTIASAKEELDRTSPWTFDYEPVYSSPKGKSGRGRRCITSVVFFPKHQLRYESTSGSIGMLGNPLDILPRSVIDRLVKNLGFSMAEIKANIVLFKTALKHFDLEQFLIETTPRASRANSPQGYVVNAVKRHLNTECGIIVTKSGMVMPKAEETADSGDEARARKIFDDTTVSQILSAGPAAPSAFRPAKKPGSDPVSLGDLLGGAFDTPEDQQLQ